MPGCTFDYAIVRVVPSVERGEFLNAGVIVFCSERGFLQARIELDVARFCAFAPDADCAMIEEHLALIPRVCSGEALGALGTLSQRERFHWLVAPRSTIIQTSPVHCGMGEDPAQAVEALFQKMVR